MASCIQIEGLLQSYIDEEASVSERLLIEEHLKSCGACSERLALNRATAATLFEVWREDQLREDLTRRVMAHLPEMPPPTSVSAALRRQVVVEGQRTRRWLGAAARLMPVFTPVILIILAGLLWVAWPSYYNMGGDEVIGMVTYCDANPDATHYSQGQARRLHVRNPIMPDDHFETGEEERLMLSLAGPSHITLLGQAAVQVRAPRAIVVTRGDVFFDVFRDNRRFQVHTPDGTITALGTSFQVSASTAGTVVTVVKGEVLVDNETSFVRLHENAQTAFTATERPTVRQGIDTSPYLRTARAVRPDPDAERRFLTQFIRNATHTPAPTEQVFVVNTERRHVNALLLKWMPDPYTSGHAGYTVYVSDSAMAPVFKTTISPEIFQDKQNNMVRLEMPNDMRHHDTHVLHITVMSDQSSGPVETTFTEVAAIGEAS